MCGHFPRAAQLNALDNGLTILLSIFHPLPGIYWTFFLGLECLSPMPPPIFASLLLLIFYDADWQGPLHEAFFDFWVELASEALL